MTDLDERDHLVLTVPAGAGGATPYAQFAGFGDGQALRAELSGRAYVAPAYWLSAEKQANLRFLGWAGNDDAEPNLFIHWSVDDPQTLAGMVTWVLRDDFHVAHPHLLTASAWGPAAANVGVLGLRVAGEDEDTAGDEPGVIELHHVLADADRAAAEREAAQLLHPVPSGHERLRSLVAEALRRRSGSPLRVDEDDDFVLTHLDQLVFVRVRRDAPVVELLAPVASDVRSRRQTALELSVLNRDHDWVKWSLRQRVVWQSLLIPGEPFVATVFDELLVTFFNAMALTRDDLVLRVGGRPCP